MCNNILNESYNKMGKISIYYQIDIKLISCSHSDMIKCTIKDMYNNVNSLETGVYFCDNDHTYICLCLSIYYQYQVNKYSRFSSRLEIQTLHSY